MSVSEASIHADVIDIYCHSKMFQGYVLYTVKLKYLYWYVTLGHYVFEYRT